MHATVQPLAELWKGHYDDAIKKKNNMVIPVVVESFGGIGTRGVRMLKFTSRRAGDRKRGRDGTRYSRVCNSISYLTHHMRQISGAASGRAGGSDYGAPNLALQFTKTNRINSPA